LRLFDWAMALGWPTVRKILAFNTKRNVRFAEGFRFFGWIKDPDKTQIFRKAHIGKIFWYFDMAKQD
jgi:hypothetical protein